MKDGVSFEQFRETVKNYSIGDIAEFVNEINKYFHLFPEYARFANSVSGVYIFDYTSFQYHYVDGVFARVAERSKDYILDRGLGPNEKIWYAPDQEIFKEHILTKNLEYFKTVPAQYRDQYLITCNYRNRSQNGDLKNVLQKSFVIRSTPDGIPLAVLGFVSDITDIRNDNVLIHSIRNTSPDRMAPVKDYNDLFYSFDGDKKFTQRQREIINYLGDGYSDKEIANKLNISIKTLDNHKLQMRLISNAKTTNALIKYAIQHGYIKI